MLWQELREEEFPQALKDSHKVCIIPIGATEKHGQHLPVGTDTLKGGKIAEMAADIEKVVVFPRLYFGNLQGLQAYPASQTGYGYIALEYELLFKLLKACVEECARNGFDRICFVSSHGGNNNILNSLIKSLCAKPKPYSVFSFYNGLIMPDKILEYIENHGGRTNFPSITDEDIKVMQDYVAAGKFDGHAGFGETALVMGTYPELVRLDRCEAEDGHSTHICNPLANAKIEWGRAWHVNYPNAYCGDAPVGLSQSIADLATKIAVEKCCEAYKVLKDDSIMEPIIAKSYKKHR